jgi:hypothetical protein
MKKKNENRIFPSSPDTIFSLKVFKILLTKYQSVILPKPFTSYT